jgi:chemotaxis protein CheX
MAAAAPLRMALIERRGGDLDLDGGEVQRLNGLCLQVLLSAAKTWEADGARLRLIDPSEPLMQTLHTAGANGLSALIVEADLPKDTLQ